MNLFKYDPKDFEGKGEHMWFWLVVLLVILAVEVLFLA